MIYVREHSSFLSKGLVEILLNDTAESGIFDVSQDSVITATYISFVSIIPRSSSNLFVIWHAFETRKVGRLDVTFFFVLALVVVMVIRFLVVLLWGFIDALRFTSLC